MTPVTRLYAFETKGINLENVEEQGRASPS
jgi:hypothetical protein